MSAARFPKLKMDSKYERGQSRARAKVVTPFGLAPGAGLEYFVQAGNLVLILLEVVLKLRQVGLTPGVMMVTDAPQTRRHRSHSIHLHLNYYLLMIVDDFNVVRSVIFPRKTYPPLVIDSYTVLPSPVSR